MIYRETEAECCLQNPRRRAGLHNMHIKHCNDGCEEHKLSTAWEKPSESYSGWSCTEKRRVTPNTRLALPQLKSPHAALSSPMFLCCCISNWHIFSLQNMNGEERKWKHLSFKWAKRRMGTHSVGWGKQANPRGTLAWLNLCAVFPEDQGHVMLERKNLIFNLTWEVLVFFS